jgi:hypothetical protein
VVVVITTRNLLTRRMEQLLMRNPNHLLSSVIALSSLLAAVPMAMAQTPATTQQPAPAPPSEHLSSYLGVSAYPSKGQTSKQQTLDEKACFDWAKSQTASIQ